MMGGHELRRVKKRRELLKSLGLGLNFNFAV